MSQSWRREGLQLDNHHLMTKEARQPSSYICLTAPRAQLLQCKEAWRDEDREEVRERERVKMVGGKERETIEGGRE